MKLMLRGVPLLVCAALFCSTLPADEKKADKTEKTADTTDKTPAKTDNAKPAPKVKKEKFEYSIKFNAKVTKLEGSTKNFTVQIPYTVPDPQRVFDNNNHYTRRIAEISRETNPQSRQQHLLELQVDMQRRAAESILRKTKDQDLQADDKTKVRILQFPTEYDDKGKPKKYTKAELKTLKGPDASLPGYKADFDQLQVGQLVTVYLAKQKQDKNKAKTDDVDPDQIRPRAALILIVADPVAQP